MNINITVTGAIFASGIAVSAWAHGGATGAACRTRKIIAATPTCPMAAKPPQST